MPEFLEELKAVDDVSGQAIQAVDEDTVYLPAAYLFEEAPGGRAVECGAGVSFVVETLFDPPAPQPLLGLKVIAADFELSLARGEVTAGIDGRAGVDGTPVALRAPSVPTAVTYGDKSTLNNQFLS